MSSDILNKIHTDHENEVKRILSKWKEALRSLEKSEKVIEESTAKSMKWELKADITRAKRFSSTEKATEYFHELERLELPISIAIDSAYKRRGDKKTTKEAYTIGVEKCEPTVKAEYEKKEEK